MKAMIQSMPRSALVGFLCFCSNFCEHGENILSVGDWTTNSLVVWRRLKAAGVARLEYFMVAGLVVVGVVSAVSSTWTSPLVVFSVLSISLRSIVASFAEPAACGLFDSSTCRLLVAVGIVI